MALYVAIVKMPRGTPIKVNFEENEGHLKAYEKMLRILHCNTSDEIAEFELMQVMDGPSYAVVATKTTAARPDTNKQLALPAPSATPASEQTISEPTYVLAA